jgi:hypothetical protein
MGLEEFNPHDKQYQKVEDLPEDKRSDFEDVDGGGFVTKKAADALRQAEAKATEENKKRPWIEKIASKNKVSGVDIIHEEAKKENEAFDQKQQEEIKRIEQHKGYVFVNNVLARELYLQVKTEDWGFLLKRGKDSVDHILENSIRGAINDLLENGNDLEKVKEYVNSKYRDDQYEENRGLYESLHEEIEKEEKSAALREELRSRYPKNPLFKTRWLKAPEGVENESAYVSVFCATREANLDRIGQDGLKFAGEEIMNGVNEVTAGEINTGKMALEKIFKGVAPDGYNRRLSVFAVPEYRDSARSGAMAQMGNVVLEIMVDADRAMIFDVELYNAIGESMQFSGGINDPDFREQALNAAKNYWASGMPLSKYLELPLAEQERLFTTPEILIPDTVPPEQINVISVLDDKVKY